MAKFLVAAFIFPVLCYQSVAEVFRVENERFLNVRQILDRRMDGERWRDKNGVAMGDGLFLAAARPHQVVISGPLPGRSRFGTELTGSGRGRSGPLSGCLKKRKNEANFR